MLTGTASLIRWALLLALVATAAFAGLQTVRLANERAAHADTKAGYARQEAERERVAREDGAEVRRLMNRHASRQQELIHAFYEKRLALAAGRASTAAADQRVHDDATAFAASRGREADGDTPSCRAAKAGLREVTALLAEGHQLAGEGADLVAERDAELEFWIGIAENDRALTAPSTPSTAPPD